MTEDWEETRIGATAICGDGMCPYILCSKFPNCNHLKKDWEETKEERDEYY